MVDRDVITDKNRFAPRVSHLLQACGLFKLSAYGRYISRTLCTERAILVDDHWDTLMQIAVSSRFLSQLY